MNISRPFILRPVFTTLIMVTIVVFGVISYRSLPVASLPEIQYPTIQVSTNYPGANADQMARLVSSPLERQFMMMQGVQYVTSSNTYQQSQIILMFHEDVDINIAAQETEQAIQKALAELPKDLPENPTYKKFNPSDTPIIYAVIYSPSISPWSLYEYGYSFLGQQLGTVQGIADIFMYGFPYAVRVQVNPQELAAMNISLEEVADAIHNANPEKPTGKFYGPQKSMGTKTNGQLVKAKDYENMIITYRDGAPVYLKDVGTVKNSLQNNKQDFKWATKTYHKGAPAVVLALYRQLGYNTVKACDDVEALLAKLAPQLPGGILIDVPFALSKWIKEAVEDVEFTLIVAFLLVVLVVYLYLGRIRNSIIPLITLPITITGTFIAMRLFGYSLDIMSLSALTLSIGFLVDDAIVVLENIVRWGETDHLNPHDAALKGSKQIILVIVAISLCLAAVFIPMLFLQGAIGQLFHEFAAVIIFAVLISGFVSLSLTPMLCSRFMAHYEVDKLTKMERFSKWLNNHLLRWYKPALGFALKHKFWVLMGSSLSIFFSIYLFMVMPQEFLPESDLGVVQGFVMANEGTSPEQMEKYLVKLRDIAIKNHYVDNSCSFASNPTDNQGLLFVNLVDRSKRPDVWKSIAALEEQFSEVLEVRVILKAYPLINLQVGGAQSGKARYQYVLQSFNTKELYKSTEKVIAAMRASPSFKNVGSDFQPNAPTLNIDLLRNQSHAFGNIDATNIEKSLMYAYGETYVSKINVPENMYYVILEVENEFLENSTKLDTLYTKNKDGDVEPVAIESVVETEVITEPETVNHLNTLTSVTIAFDPGTGVALSNALEEVRTITESILPTSVLGQVLGNTAAFEKSMKQFVGLVILSIFVIYIILGILYENFLHPLTALSAIPVALLGGILSLLICGEVLSIYALIGLIMLLGIVMKNGILIIDFSLEIMENEGLPAHEATYHACLLRFRPIVMTTLAAMMGAIPIATGMGGTVAAGRAPLGIAVVGGLAFAQLVTLFLIPVVFIYIQRLNTHLTTKFKVFEDKDDPQVPKKKKPRKKPIKKKPDPSTKPCDQEPPTTPEPPTKPCDPEPPTDFGC